MGDATVERIEAGDELSESADIVEANLESMRGLFPTAFSEDGIDFDVLRQLLGGEVAEGDEKYGLNWHGKRQARRIALAPSMGTLRPCPEESVDWDTTQNLMIEGDNLEVLKLLQKSYSGKVKLIYIDPPYNTGKDFVYKDDYRDNIKNYLELTGQTDEEGKKLSTNVESSGRFHTDWLNMMYPRLKLARNLLRDNGVIAVAIDDGELSNLSAVMVEIFGEENHLAVLVNDRNRKNDAKFFSVGHDYTLVYAKSKAYLREIGAAFREQKVGVDEVRTEYKRLRLEHGGDNELVASGLKSYYVSIDSDDPRYPLTRFTRVDERGPYRADGNPSWPGGGGPRYDVLHPTTGRPVRVPSRGWVWPTRERMQQEIAAGNIIFGLDETTTPGVRMGLFDGAKQVMRTVNFIYAQTATQQLARLFDDVKVFDNPKDVGELDRLARYLSTDGDVILDFFAGSGTTGHGVMLANAKERSSRRFVLVQMQESLTDGAWAALTELTKERLRRAGVKVKEDHAGWDGDVGFRVFKLDTSNIRAWSPDRDEVEDSLLDYREHLADDRSEDDILYEMLLKLGLDLCVPIEERDIGGVAVSSVGGGVLMTCLAESIPVDAIEALGTGIVGWLGELEPAGDTTVIFRDSAFENDVAKTNIAAILSQAGVVSVRSI